MGYLAAYDPDPDKPARAKLDAAIAQYQERYGSTPRFCLTSREDAAELTEPTPGFPDTPPVVIKARSYISRYSYYIGEADA